MNSSEKSKNSKNYSTLEEFTTALKAAFGSFGTTVTQKKEQPEPTTKFEVRFWNRQKESMKNFEQSEQEIKNSIDILNEKFNEYFKDKTEHQRQNFLDKLIEKIEERQKIEYFNRDDVIKQREIYEQIMDKATERENWKIYEKFFRKRAELDILPKEKYKKNEKRYIFISGLILGIIIAILIINILK